MDYDQELGTNSSFVELLATCVLLKKSHQWLRLQNGFHKFCMFILATLHGADLKPLHTPFLEPSLCERKGNTVYPDLRSFALLLLEFVY